MAQPERLKKDTYWKVKKEKLISRKEIKEINEITAETIRTHQGILRKKRTGITGCNRTNRLILIVHKTC
ncbi:uncharacterized protein OCT59_001472 [Rhizophagus irregularis]|nr:hypothetical protein GLOIN_2v1692903 [Rhizophagus irregularis DAOM 181602=DAOM 197198]POG62797.1 hypothetical protein GLOIN_2v1692903 [Rhizophagus irregularis DAOM 181602=DAOM 197198]UZO00220.1 hypothetical protein OCT59_001472 [Rhizophagus irregularis]GBC50596.2 hypothetical protein GLOIN_2v1692903 [Rhizophagus irregularis DAOM 181602=DAOM 197198]|eukprot:XP_025169663.1 hypothetical protein GLOIN_2v1692903 [Rhizophagus irregularis DAOM 181602=DAOM 197198]